jgi:hypothetical protein
LSEPGHEEGREEEMSLEIVPCNGQEHEWTLNPLGFEYCQKCGAIKLE